MGNRRLPRPIPHRPNPFHRLHPSSIHTDYNSRSSKSHGILSLALTLLGSGQSRPGPAPAPPLRDIRTRNVRMYVEKSTKKGKDIPICMIYSPSEEPPDFYVPILGCVFPYSRNYSPSLVSPPDDGQLKKQTKICIYEEDTGNACMRCLPLRRTPRYKRRPRKG